MTEEREPTELYNQGGIKITDWPAERDGHFLYIGTADPERGYALMRGALNDLARRVSLQNLEASLTQVNPAIMHVAREEGITSDQIRLAFNQARIKELEGQSRKIFRMYEELLGEKK